MNCVQPCHKCVHDCCDGLKVYVYWMYLRALYRKDNIVLQEHWQKVKTAKFCVCMVAGMVQRVALQFFVPYCISRLIASSIFSLCPFAPRVASVIRAPRTSVESTPRVAQYPLIHCGGATKVYQNFSITRHNPCCC